MQKLESDLKWIKDYCDQIKNYQQQYREFKNRPTNDRIDLDQGTTSSTEKPVTYINLPPLRPDQIKQLALIDAMGRYVEENHFSKKHS